MSSSEDRRGSERIAAFFEACATGDLETVRHLLSDQPGLAAAEHDGTTALHAAVPHPDVLRLLLEHGADPDVREAGDNALALHFAAGGGPLESVRLLLDAGSDPVGAGDLHLLDVIGWATVFDEARRDVVDLLLERGARHHVFSAIALNDPELVRRVVRDDPGGLSRRLSRFEQFQTAVHYVVAPADGLVGGRFRTGEHHATLRTLIDLGADLEAQDAEGRTPLVSAMLRGDREAMRILRDAGARVPDAAAAADAPGSGPASRSPSPDLARSMGAIRPMIAVSDMDASIAWYGAVGFVLTASHGEGGRIDWANLVFGEAELMLVPRREGTREASRGLSLWIDTDRLDDLYARVRASRMARARAELAGEDATGPDLVLVQDLHTAFYGQREFGLQDPDGVHVMFAQPLG